MGQHLDQLAFVGCIHRRTAHGRGYFHQHVARLLGRHFMPDGGALAQFGDVLPVLQLLDQVAARAVLVVGQRLEHAMAIEQARNLSEAVALPIV